MTNARSWLVLAISIGLSGGAGCTGDVSSITPATSGLPCTDEVSCCPKDQLVCQGDIDGQSVCTCADLWECSDNPTKCDSGRLVPGGGSWNCSWTSTVYSCVSASAKAPVGGGRWTCQADTEHGTVCTTTAPVPPKGPTGGGVWACTPNEAKNQISCERVCLKTENCTNGIDDDCDGALDGADSDCSQPQCAASATQVCDSGQKGACKTGAQSCELQNGVLRWGDCKATATPKAEVCTNGIDDDCDGLVDGADSDCPPAPPPECTSGATQACDSGKQGACTAGVKACVLQSGLWKWGACTATVTAKNEVCNNGIDDNCNGQTDEGGCTCPSWTTVTCEDMGQDPTPNCNTSPANNVAACIAQGSTSCSDAQLAVWCNRAADVNNPWFQLPKAWVEQQCGHTGMITEYPDHSIATCEDAAKCVIYSCLTPLVLVFDPTARVAYRPDDGEGHFDLSTAQDGSGLRTDWPTARTPWLAIDLDGDGLITSGRELFGSATALGGGFARNGFEALAALDRNGDGVLDVRDPAFSKLRLWSDDGDRVSTPAELRTLEAVGVVALQVGHRVELRCDGRGNCERERSSFTWRDRAGAAHEGAVVDVHLSVRGASAALPATCSATAPWR